MILDESCGIPAQLWTAVEAITTNADCRILAIGNPDDPAPCSARCANPAPDGTSSRSRRSTHFTDEPVPDRLRPLLSRPSGSRTRRSSGAKRRPATPSGSRALRQRFEAGDIDIDPADDDRGAQLGAIRYKYTARGQVQIESKDDMRKRKTSVP